MRAGDVVAQLTLVTLAGRPFDIATSVSETDAAVYSPAVLRLRGQPRASDGAPKILTTSPQRAAVDPVNSGPTAARDVSIGPRLQDDDLVCRERWPMPSSPRSIWLDPNPAAPRGRGS